MRLVLRSSTPENLYLLSRIYEPLNKLGNAFVLKFHGNKIVVIIRHIALMFCEVYRKEIFHEQA